MIRTHTPAAHTTTSPRIPSQRESVQSSGYALPNQPLLSTIIFPNGGLLTIEWECGCWCEAYYHTTNPEKFQLWDVHVCDTHGDWFVPIRRAYTPAKQSTGTFHYDCRNCGYPLWDDDDFECEASSEEVHNEIPGPNNVEYFGGGCSILVPNEVCPLCTYPLAEDAIYYAWELYQGRWLEQD